MFDAGSIEAKLTVDPSAFDRAMAKAEARVKKFEDEPHKVKILAQVDSGNLTRARKAFGDLDNAISKDAMNRLRSSPQGSVLGALNALFSPHPVTGAPTPSQAATQGLLGKMISQPGGGGPVSGANDNRTNPVSQILTQGGTATENIRRNLEGPAPGNVSTTDTIRQNLTGNAPGNVTTTDTIRRNVVGAAPGNTTTTNTVREKLDPASAAKTERDSGSSGGRSSIRWTLGFGAHLGPFFAGFSKQLGNAGSAGGAKMGSGLLGGIGPGILGISAKLSGIVGLVGAALGALPALAGIIGTGMGVALSGGLVAAAIATSPGLKKEFASIGKQAKTTITQAVAPIVPAIQGILRQVPGLLKQLEPQLASISKAIAPQLQQVFAGLIPIIHGLIGVMQAAAPAFGPFIGALEGLISNLLPGIATVVKATIPFVTQFAGILGNLGHDLGSLFSTAAPAIGASMQILGGLLGLLGDLLPAVMKIADIFATALAPVFVAFTGVIRTLIPPLVQIGSVIASFAGAVIGDLASAFGAVATLIGALAPSLRILASTLSNVFTIMENAGVFAIFGDALENLAVPLANLINALVVGLAPVLPVIVNAASQLVTILVGGLSAALGAVLTVLTPVASVLAQVVVAVVNFLQSSGLLLPVMAGLAIAFGPVSSGLVAMGKGLALFTGSSFAAAISGMVGSIAAFGAAAEGAAVSEKALVAAELLFESISPFALIAVGVAGFGALALVMSRTAGTITGITQNLAAQDNAVGYNIAGYQKLAGQLGVVSASYAKVAGGIQDSVRGGNGAAAQLSQQASTVSSQFSAMAVNMQLRLTALSDDLGVSQTVVEQWASAAGISAQKFGGSSENVTSLTNAIVGFVDKNPQAVLAASSLATKIAIFGDDVFSTTTNLDAFNAIWNTLVGSLLSKQEAVTNSNAAFDNLAQTIQTSGKNSDSAKQSFQQYIAQIGSSASTLLQNGASISTINSYLQGQIDHIKTLGPLNASEKADLQALSKFQDTLANSTKGLNSQQLTLIGQFEQHLIPDLVSMHADTPKVNTDISNLTNAILQTGNKSAATAGDRAKLIADLEAVGVKSSVATGFVDGLQNKIDALHSKVVQVGVNATAQGTLNAIAHLPGVASSTSSSLVFAAQGMLVSGGIPGKDSVLAMLAPGELVVPAAMVSSGAVDNLRGSIPGFASGGLVNLDQPGQWAAGQEGSWGQKTAAVWAQAVKNSFELAAASAAKASAQQFIATQGASGGIIQAMFATLAAARGWTGPMLTALLQVEAREAGFNMTAQNPTSGAYGLAQFINGASEYAQYGGNSTTASGQITAMLNYIAQRYGNPEAAWQHELDFGWYGKGGPIDEPVIGYGMNSHRGYVIGESGREWLVPDAQMRGGDGASTAAMLAKMDELIAAARAIPAGVGDRVGGALGGAAQSASLRNRYPVGGA